MRIQTILNRVEKFKSFVNGEASLKPGDRLSVMVEAADAYDLWANSVEAKRPPQAGMTQEAASESRVGVSWSSPP